MGRSVRPRPRRDAIGCEKTVIRQTPRVRRPPVQAYCSDDTRRHVSAGLGRRPSISCRFAANRRRGIATSASWNVTDRPCRTTLPPILIGFSRSVLSDQCATSLGRADVPSLAHLPRSGRIKMGSGKRCKAEVRVRLVLISATTFKSRRDQCGRPLERCGAVAYKRSAGGRSSEVERQLPKLNVVGSIPIARSSSFEGSALARSIFMGRVVAGPWSERPGPLDMRGGAAPWCVTGFKAIANLREAVARIMARGDCNRKRLRPEGRSRRGAPASRIIRIRGNQGARVSGRLGSRGSSGGL